MTSGSHRGATPASSILQVRKQVLGVETLCPLRVTVVLALPPLTCPKGDRPWLWATSSPVSTSQLSALGEEGGEGQSGHSPHWGLTRVLPEPLTSRPHQGLGQAWASLRSLTRACCSCA